MASAKLHNGIELCYEVIEPKESPPKVRVPLLLIQGLGGQLISWDDDFCDELADRGWTVVRFDNRDVGLSTKLEGAGLPRLGDVLAGDYSSVAYGLADMAEDAAGLIEALGFPCAHVVGISMGGMIAQSLAITRPDLVASLTSIMSTTGNRSVGLPTQEGLQVIFTPPATTRQEAVETQLAVWKVLWGSAHPFEEERVTNMAARLFDRSFYPDGVARHVAAIVSQPDRTEALGRLRMPTLVVHGNEDPLVSLSGGEATARAIPGAEFLVMEGVGHCLPRPVWAQVCDAISRVAEQGSLTRRERLQTY